MKLSVIIPAYNEAGKIEKSVLKMDSCLAKQARSYEIIVVDDGSRDQTHSVLVGLAGKLSTLKIIHNKINQGKGQAVKSGVAAAEGDFIFFTDADLSTPPEEILNFMKIFEAEKTDILIGSRHVNGAQIRIPQPFHRRMMGRVFNLCVKILTPLRFEDTQCGFKGFRRDSAQKIFSNVKEQGFNFDIEALLLAKKLGFRVEEIPIEWSDCRESKISPLWDSIKMFVDLVRLSRAYKNL